ncbi:FAD-binding oxidoreductase [Ideonella sp. A 288]|uniref:NAD(P)/FAD-dependent oxidoreductase n=1 Tax=Ideonella sp. A 288 TaxID=1962181 RepID=UPI000B4AD49A|nr:FAD-binding oxidoreductase [Ideonella sp. A 288]
MRVVVIGGGAIGAAVALFLRREAGTAVEVVVVEPDPGLTQASSGRSASSIRQQFSQPLNVRLSQFGLDVVSHATEWLGVDGEAVDLGLVDAGYLFVATEAGAPALRTQHTAATGAGADVSLLSPDALAQRCPWLRTDDLALATLGESGEGWFDGPALARALARKARALGACWHRGRVTGFDRRGDRLVAALTDDGARLEADAFVCAAGPWSGAVGRLAGVEVPVHARRRTVFVFDCPTALPPTPLVVDPAGVWFRSEGRGFIGGWSPGPGDDDPDDLPIDDPDLAQFEDRLWPALAHRVPAFEALRRRSAWAGYYEVHPLDHNALVGPHPALPNLVLACGFSGHGLQHAPATGRGVAEWLLHGAYRSLDLSPLGCERLRTGHALEERAII